MLMDGVERMPIWALIVALIAQEEGGLNERFADQTGLQKKTTTTTLNQSSRAIT